MSESKAPARPPQVTMAGWMTVGASIFMLVNVFTYVSQLRTIDNREAVADTLSRDPLKGMGIDLEQALSMLHGAALVAGACAAATAILGWFALQRNRQARVALSVLVLPLFFSGLIASPFLSSMIAVSVILLWARPARDWFNGITPEPPARRTTPVATPTPPAPDEPRSFEGFGDTPDGQAGQVATAARRPATTSTGPVTDRPTEVLQACVVTWVMSALVVLGMGTVAVGLLVMPDVLTEIYESDSRFAESEISVDQLKVASVILAVMFSLWAIGAMVLAGFAYRGQNWARIVLIISASVAGLMSLALVISSPLLLVVAATCAATVLLLCRRRTVEWFKPADRP
ncbi:hypothetical protein [Nocardioides jensenii]|uniref:hypothetical protein n=1 Tax=Nocardioides jensenii TaxID=1843 RepID=UPI00082BF8D9|nr:hypothetical protein [Nocardioides jensenii]